MTPKEIVLAFWEAMKTNDFAHAAEWLSADFDGHWPQSGEHILGPAHFAAVNTAYPANGRWTFELHQIVAEGAEVVTDVSVTDGTLHARAITFHTVRDGKISAQREFWPDPFPAPEWRAQWVSFDGSDPAPD